MPVPIVYCPLYGLKARLLPLSLPAATISVEPSTPFWVVGCAKDTKIVETQSKN